MQQTRILVGSVISLVFLLGVMGYYVLVGIRDADPLAAPPLWLVAAQVVAGLLVHLACDRAGYRTAPLPAGLPAEDARRAALAAYQSRSIVRTALAEAIAVVSFAVAFVLQEDGAWAGYLTGAAVSVVLLLVHAWPWTRPIDRTAESLEREGARSGLRETFGLAPRLTGAVREL